MKKFFFALLILAFLAAGSLYFAKQRIFAPSETENWTTFQVENGSSAVKIGKILEANGLISNGKLFSWWCRLEKIQLKAGWYDIPPKTSIASLAEILSSGKTATRKVTIPEGRASWEMPAYFREAIPDFDSTQWENLVHDAEFAKELGINARSLEGYLLPDTYPIE